MLAERNGRRAASDRAASRSGEPLPGGSPATDAAAALALLSTAGAGFVGSMDGTPRLLWNAAPHGQAIVDVTAQGEAPVNHLPGTLTGVEDDPIFFSGGVFIDPPPTASPSLFV